MAAQLQPSERSDETLQPGEPGTARPRHRVNRKRRRGSKANGRLVGWVSKLGVFVGVMAGVVTMVLGLRQIIPAQANPSLEVDGQAMLIRSLENNQIELQVNLTLMNEGAKTAVIRRPKVSLYVDSPDNSLNLTPENLHFRPANAGSGDQGGEVLFPVTIADAKSAEKITCSVGCGPDCPNWDEWQQQGRWVIDLDFAPGGSEALSRCLAFVFPVPASLRDMVPGKAKRIGLVDCSDLDGFTRRRP